MNIKDVKWVIVEREDVIYIENEEGYRCCYEEYPSTMERETFRRFVACANAMLGKEV